MYVVFFIDCDIFVQCRVCLLHLVWLNVKILLRYCLFLRGAPHRLKAKIFHCTKLVPLMFPAGATLLHISGFHSCLICISKWHARNDWMAAKMGGL
ncbi:hypothetical protein CWM66_05445 [Kosakonia sp. H7A]|nr:hypothetical protein CWM66_05445 [Kosakonia sp. H7A]